MTDIDVTALRARAIDQAAQVAKQSTVAVDVTGVWLGSRYHPVIDPAVVLALLDRLAVAEAAVERVRALAAVYDSWTGERPSPGESSPNQREQLHTAIEGRQYHEEQP